MINPFKEVNWQPGRAEIRKFALSLVIGFPCVALVLLLVGRILTKSWHPERPLWVGGVGTGAGVVFLLLPVLARPFYLAWYFLACCVGLVVSNVLMSAFYFLIITPVGLALRACGRRPLEKRLDKGGHSYWKDVEPVKDVRRYYQQF